MKFNTLKRFKLLENESFFQEFQNFSCPKTIYLSKFSIFQFLWSHPINREKFQMNAIIYFRSYQQPQQNWLQKKYWKGDENS